MNLFADYVQPLTNWLQTNPHWSLFFTFIISLTESLAIIGSIVPGSVTMTAIGILAGSGIMRIDLTLIAAILGAVCGDSLSYALGYFYSERLVDIWPFKKYPHWLTYGKDFFTRHGGKSVLIGRFVGPLRSIIPVIAGIMHMKQWRFLIANVVSAIGWALLYVMPGVLIGAAGHELSAESATRLFVIILVLLACIWVLSLLIKWGVIKLNAFLKRKLHNHWIKLKNHSLLDKMYFWVTPEDEQNHYPTAVLLLLTLLNLFGLIVIVILNTQTTWFNYINLPIYLLIESVHSSLLQAIFIIGSQSTSTLTLVSLFIISSLWFVYQKQFKTVIYLASSVIWAMIVALLLSHCIDNPRPQGLLITQPGSSFPAINLAVATSFYGFIVFYMNSKFSLLTNTSRTFIFILLAFSGCSAVYLGDYWFTDVIAAYVIGAVVCLIHCLMYRKKNTSHIKMTPSTTMLLSFLAIAIGMTTLSAYINFKDSAHQHTPYHKEFVLTESDWWNQQQPLLPLYRLNRIGNRISLLNIQYAGDLNALQSNLEQQGWELHEESFFTKLLMRVNNKSTEIKLPLLTQLYENKRPELTMTYKDAHSDLILELSMWESNYNLYELRKPLWIGSIHSHVPNEKHSEATPLMNPITYLLPALEPFTLRRIKVSHRLIKKTKFTTIPLILLIKNPHIDKQKEPH